jgi:hypothetical protein
MREAFKVVITHHLVRGPATQPSEEIGGGPASLPSEIETDIGSAESFQCRLQCLSSGKKWQAVHRLTLAVSAYGG